MSQTHKSHHFVPAFLLRRWESGPSGKLLAYRWEGKRFLCSERKATAVANQDHLNSMNRESPEPDVSLERDYLGPEIDDKAAVALKAIERAGLQGLSPQMREDWTRFLVAQTMRSPDRNEQMRSIAKSFMAMFVRDQLEAAGVPPDDELLSSAYELSDTAMKAFRHAVDASPLWAKVASSTWGLLEFHESKGELLIGDEPVSYSDDGAGGFMLAMPLGPKRLLLVCGDPAQLQRLAQSKVDTLLSMNEQMVEQTWRSVYATSDRYSDFIKERLPKCD